MKPQSPRPCAVDFEKLLAESLKIDVGADSGPRFSSDVVFLAGLNERLAKRTVQPKASPIWINGILGGMAAAAAGLILFAGLNILPPFFYRASVTGAGLVREKILDASVQQEIAWQQLMVAIQTQAKNRF